MLMAQRKSLSDILSKGDLETLSRAWDETQAAKDFGPLPPGIALAPITSPPCFHQ